MTAACAVGSQAFALTAAELPPTVSAGSKLPQRPLGRTGVEVSALALGGVIGMQRPPSADHDPTALAETALDLGITYFDTAPSYNNGQSETNYGQVLARRRKEVFLATKTGDRRPDPRWHLAKYRAKPETPAHRPCGPDPDPRHLCQ